LHTKQTFKAFLASENKSFPFSNEVAINPKLWEQAICWNFLNLSPGDQLDLLSEFISFHAMSQHKEKERV